MGGFSVNLCLIPQQLLQEFRGLSAFMLYQKQNLGSFPASLPSDRKKRGSVLVSFNSSSINVVSSVFNALPVKHGELLWGENQTKDVQTILFIAENFLKKRIVKLFFQFRQSAHSGILGKEKRKGKRNFATLSIGKTPIIQGFEIDFSKANRGLSLIQSSIIFLRFCLFLLNSLCLWPLAPLG